MVTVVNLPLEYSLGFRITPGTPPTAGPSRQDTAPTCVTNNKSCPKDHVFLYVTNPLVNATSTRVLFVFGSLSGMRLYVSCHSEEQSDEESPPIQHGLSLWETLHFTQSDMYKAASVKNSSIQTGIYIERILGQKQGKRRNCLRSRVFTR
jgi:hypothetical protein